MQVFLVSSGQELGCIHAFKQVMLINDECVICLENKFHSNPK